MLTQPHSQIALEANSSLSRQELGHPSTKDTQTGETVANTAYFTIARTFTTHLHDNQVTSGLNEDIPPHPSPEAGKAFLYDVVNNLVHVWQWRKLDKHVRPYRELTEIFDINGLPFCPRCLQEDMRGKNTQLSLFTNGSTHGVDKL